jgi:hypothetical protein
MEKFSCVYPSMVGVKNPERIKINKIKGFQNSGNSFRFFSVFKKKREKIGSCEKRININNKIISKLITSVKDQRFSKVFSP